LLCGLKYS
jgi:serine/threonine protein kinase